MRFVWLYLRSVKLILISYASFSNYKGLKAQLGYIIALANSSKSKIVHYGCNRCRRVVRNVMAAEVHGLVLGLEYAFILRKRLFELLGNVGVLQQH